MAKNRTVGTMTIEDLAEVVRTLQVGELWDAWAECPADAAKALGDPSLAACIHASAVVPPGHLVAIKRPMDPFETPDMRIYVFAEVTDA